MLTPCTLGPELLVTAISEAVMAGHRAQDGECGVGLGHPTLLTVPPCSAMSCCSTPALMPEPNPPQQTEGSAQCPRRAYTDALRAHNK